MNFKIFLFFQFVFFSSAIAQSSLQPGDHLEYYYRLLQITNSSEDQSSFMIRPVDIDLNTEKNHAWRHILNDHKQKKSNLPKNGKIAFYEPLWFNSLNTSVPRGINDGAIWQGKGYNTAFSAGMGIVYGPLQISFRPQVGFSQNIEFDLGPYDPPLIISRYSGINEPASKFAYRDFVGRYDYVQRYGDSPYLWGSLGASAVELRGKGLTIGLSNKQIWSGPGVHSSLQFGYNAPGFPHLYLGTYKPLKSPIGSFEFAYIFGGIKSSEFFIESQRLSQSVNSLMLSYSPPFADNFYIGAVRTFFQHCPENFKEYRIMALKMFEFLFRDSQEEWDPDNQVANVFMRYILPDYGVEIYGEYGRNDHNADLRDFKAQPNHARAYTVGMIKASKLSLNRILAINIELTQTDAMRAGLTRGEKNIGGRLGGWYGHAHQVMGFTSRGQIMGSGYGPGLNSQIIKTELLDSGGKVGLKLARIVYHNSKVDQSFDAIQKVNDDEVERWEVRNVEIMAGVDLTRFFSNGLEITASIEQSFIYNQHNLKGNDLLNTRLELILRKNIRGWLR